jgi:hypothetical protein
MIIRLYCPASKTTGRRQAAAGNASLRFHTGPFSTRFTRQQEVASDQRRRQIACGSRSPQLVRGRAAVRKKTIGFNRGGRLRLAARPSPNLGSGRKAAASKSTLKKGSKKRGQGQAHRSLVGGIAKQAKLLSLSRLVVSAGPAAGERPQTIKSEGRGAKQNGVHIEVGVAGEQRGRARRRPGGKAVRQEGREQQDARHGHRETHTRNQTHAHNACTHARPHASTASTRSNPTGPRE